MIPAPLSQDSLYLSGVDLLVNFCVANQLTKPNLVRLTPDDRRYHLGSCAYYRHPNLHIMVEKCAVVGMGGRAWSWPGYVIDRTPYGVLQHELGHHIDELRSTLPLTKKEDLFAYRVHQQSKEPPLTNYLGTDNEDQTYYKEWLAEILRLFVTNPDLLSLLRPKSYQALLREGLRPVITSSWQTTLERFNVTERILAMAGKKLAKEAFRHVKSDQPGLPFQSP